MVQRVYVILVVVRSSSYIKDCTDPAEMIWGGELLGKRLWEKLQCSRLLDQAFSGHRIARSIRDLQHIIPLRKTKNVVAILALFKLKDLRAIIALWYLG